MNLNVDFDQILHSDCDQILNKILLTKSPLKKQGFELGLTANSVLLKINVWSGTNTCVSLKTFVPNCLLYLILRLEILCTR